MQPSYAPESKKSKNDYKKERSQLRARSLAIRTAEPRICWYTMPRQPSKKDFDSLPDERNDPNDESDGRDDPNCSSTKNSSAHHAGTPGELKTQYTLASLVSSYIFKYRLIAIPAETTPSAIPSKSWYPKSLKRFE